MNPTPFYKKVSFNVLVLVVVSMVFGAGYMLGNASQSEARSTKEADFSDVNLSTFWEVWETLDEKYPDAKNVSTEDRVWGAISGLVDSVKDPYTVYFTPPEAEEFATSIKGEFSGVGMEIGLRDKVLTVISPLKNTPAFKAGILAGDVILKIDDTSTEGMSTEKAIGLIRGEKGTTVRLTIFREDNADLIDVSLVRDTIVVPPLETEIKDGVFLINFYSFSENSEDEFAKALKEFAKSNTDKMIIDLRGNPGGYLDSAITIASWFVDGGEPVVIEEFGNNKSETIYRSKGFTIPKKPSKIVVLVDGGSASASEILAGALSEYNLATLVGEKTYGKGSVQEVVPFGDDSALKVTVAKWLTPKRHSISEQGLTPDVVVEMEVSEDPENEKDAQYEKALEILKK
ncbi:MAG: S41 family peptidase [Candidatus Pacebacteria bacterium]|nr:S41 family peptidase [Candidatus Paceibacterota bacterium]MBP9780378.1 S41 family peptidase [Candidatus Paceibacterota bacterium]MDQ5961760.1 carboxyl-terminal processing protease [Patescibacteria group bacterium]